MAAALPPGLCTLRTVDRVAVKGKSTPVLLHEVLDVLSDETRAAREATRADFDAGREDFSNGRFSAALVHFEHCIEVDPSDVSALSLAERTRDLLAHGSPPGFDGVNRLDAK